jgi:glycosyltransferase involved in cell wall biosynthesis
MHLLKLATSGILGTLTVSGFIEREMNNIEVDNIEPVDMVSVIVPSFNEEPFIKKCLSSIRGQSIIQEYPQYFEIILVDSNSKDKTVELGAPYVDKIINVRTRGKLTAKNLATSLAQGNIIVSADADTYYPPFWLGMLLRPFNDIYSPDYGNIAGVVGSTYDPHIPGVPAPLRNIAEILDRKIIHPNQMVGRNCAYYKHGFYLAGGLDETINQLNVKEMIKEEEQGFGNRLAKLGKIAFRLNAVCLHLGGQKIGCRLGTANRDVCNNYGISIERFG